MIKQADELEEILGQQKKYANFISHILVNKFSRILMQRAEKFAILRRKPVPGYSISFLITNIHTEGIFFAITKNSNL